MRTKLCWRHSRNFHFFISACSLMMVISFYLLFICTDYFLYKLELYFYWLHVSFFIVRALKKFQKRILLGFGLSFCLLVCNSRGSRRRLFLGSAGSPAEPFCSPLEAQ